MNSALIADVIGYVGAAFTAAMSLLQALRIRRAGLEGVSTMTWTTILWLMAFWLVYGVGTGLLPVAIGNAVCLVAVLFTLWCIGVTRSLRTLPVSALCVFVLTAIPMLLWGWDAGIPGAGIVAFGLVVPQIAALYRTDTAAGVSATAWINACISVGIWIIYGVMVQRFAIVALDSAIFAVNFTVVLLTLARHRKLTRLEAAAHAHPDQTS